MLGRAENAAGDPAKVARLVLRVAALDEPPVRLLLGSDAYVYGAAAALAARAEEDARWEATSAGRPTADDATAEQTSIR